MAVEKTTVARPYAQAAFAFARDRDELDRWSEMLALSAAVIEDTQVAELVDNPELTREQKADLLLDIAGDRLTAEAQNLMRLLADNSRLSVLPEIAELFEALKNEAQGRLDVHVIAAYVLSAAQERELAEALQRKLGREIQITSEKDPSLIAGVRIQAGDLVIDGSFKSQLQKLAIELEI